jgi:hypothetical protein
VNVHDFEDKKLGKVVPYGVYDVTADAGFVSVGITSDTAEFAVASIGNVRSFVYEISVKADFRFYTSRPRHQRNGRPGCLAASSGQAPKPRSGAPQAQGLTAKVGAKRSLKTPRCRSCSSSGSSWKAIAELNGKLAHR